MRQTEQTMEYTTLGNTGMTVSRMGMGCGGHSRLGLSSGGTSESAADIVRAAIDLGVNFIDTAESYGTEEAVGMAIRGLAREKLVLSTKVGSRIGGSDLSPIELRQRLEGSLRRLGTDYVDVYHLHGVTPDEYPHALDVLNPVLQELKAEGKIRAAGITEAFIPDPGHVALSQAAADGVWDVVMVGFNLLNQSARTRVLPLTQARGVGTLCMFAVRRALSQPAALEACIAELIANGQLSVADVSLSNPLGFLVESGVATSIQDAAYRFCRHEPGLDVILVGTGNAEHLAANAKSILSPPLPAEVHVRLVRMFGKIDSVSGN